MNPDDDLAVKMYVQELATVQPLTKQEEARLFQEMLQPGERGVLAERRLIESHLHRVLPIAERYTSSGLSLLDLIQEGNLGLMRAIKEFPQTEVNDFAVYATFRIEEAIRSAIANRDLNGA